MMDLSIAMLVHQRVPTFFLGHCIAYAFFLATQLGHWIIPIPCIFFPSLSLSLYVYIYRHTHIYIHIGKSESHVWSLQLPQNGDSFVALFWAPHFLLLHRGRGTFMHYSNIYSFGRSVAQRLRVVDSTEQYKLKNNRLRQFERALTKKLAAGLSGYVFSTLWKLSHSHGKWPIEIDGLPNLNIVDLSMVFRTSKCWIFPMVIGYTSYLPIYRWFTYQTTRGYIFL